MEKQCLGCPCSQMQPTWPRTFYAMEQSFLLPSVPSALPPRIATMEIMELVSSAEKVCMNHSLLFILSLFPTPHPPPPPKRIIVPYPYLVTILKKLLDINFTRPNYIHGENFLRIRYSKDQSHRFEQCLEVLSIRFT